MGGNIRQNFHHLNQVCHQKRDIAVPMIRIIPLKSCILWDAIPGNKSTFSVINIKALQFKKENPYTLLKVH